MQIVVYDTLAELEPLFTSRAHPAALFARAQRTLEAPDGLYARLRPLHRAKDQYGFDVLAAVQYDGYEAALGQQMWGLFNPARDRDVSAWEFARLRAERVVDTVATHLRALTVHLRAAGRPARVECFILPADPANRTVMAWNHGLSCFAGVPGYLLLQIWPSPGNLTRLPTVLARALAQNVRWAWHASSRPATLADHLAIEGLAAAFAGAVAPVAGMEPWAAPFAQPADWDAELAAVAARYGLASYDDLMTNVYGSPLPVGGVRPPEPLPLVGDDLAYARAVIAEALHATDARIIAAHLYGDALVAPQGHPPAGLPPYAGIAVAYDIARRYREQAGGDWGKTLAVSTAEFLLADGAA